MTKSVILACGKQYRVSAGDYIDINLKNDASESDKISFDVCVYRDGDNIVVGTPFVDGIKAVCKVVADVKGPKGIAYKYKRRKGYSRKVGYRQTYTRVIVEEFQKA